MSSKYEHLDEEVIRLLDGWFGESLEDSEEEELHHKHLYKPLSDLIKKYKERYCEC